MGAVDVLDIKDAAQAKEQHFGQGWSQLRRGDQHIDAILSLSNHAEALERQCGPIIGGHFDFGAYLQPSIALAGTEQSAHTAKEQKKREIHMVNTQHFHTDCIRYTYFPLYVL